MRLMLTSFGIGSERGLADYRGLRVPQGYDLRHEFSHIQVNPPHGSVPTDPLLFRRMPPVRLGGMLNVFMPDYAALLLCEQVVVDDVTFALLQRTDPRSPYHLMAETITALHSEGFVELVSFESILDNNRDLLDAMLSRDLQAVDSWLESFRESRHLWGVMVSAIARTDESFSQEENISVGMFLHHAATLQRADFFAEEALSSASKSRRKQHREALVGSLTPYLDYVNANLVIANSLDVGFHDWADFDPFYRQKFLGVGRTGPPGHEHLTAANKLFTVSFPEFAIDRTSTLLRAVTDDRIGDLRRLVQRSVDGEVEFDEDFAKSILTEVLRSERKAARYRNMVSYLTIPLSLIPGIGLVLPKVVEEGVGAVIDNLTARGHRWFYLLSSFAEEARDE